MGRLVIGFVGQPIEPILAPDSDATTVPAATPEAQRMVRESLAQAQVAQASTKAKTPEAETPAEPRQQLSRQVQSTELLQPAKKMKVKKSESSTTLDYRVDPKNGSKRTAVKAKAAPPQSVSGLAVPPDMTKTVQQCLARSNTAELEAKTTAHQAKAAPVPAEPVNQDPQEDQASQTEDESEEEDPAELKRKEEEIRLKKEAHARYMRFSRSLTSTSSVSMVYQVWTNWTWVLT